MVSISEVIRDMSKEIDTNIQYMPIFRRRLRGKEMIKYRKEFKNAVLKSDRISKLSQNVDDTIKGTSEKIVKEIGKHEKAGMITTKTNTFQKEKQEF